MITCRAAAAGGRRGFTLIELMVVIALVAIFIAILLDRIQLTQEAAEKTAVEQTLGSIRSALYLQVAALLLKGRENEIGSLARRNPVELLADPPRGYVGEFAASEPRVERGSWYYDLGRHELVYVPNLDTHLKVGAGGLRSDGRKALRFQVEIEYALPAPGRSTASFVAIRLRPSVNYVWAAG